MPTVVPVKFQYVTHDLWFDPKATGVREGDHVICSTERGQEIGLVTRDAREVDASTLRDTVGDAPLRPVLRLASPDDLEHAEQLAERGEHALPTFRNLVHALGLDMKPVGVEYLFGGGRVVCYFSAEERVDFRQLVRELARELHERVDMRQIGVREEAALAGGYAHCGQELCCARLGREFEPVSIRMAKEQDLPLNTSKISGACGRLMCCLRYEFDAYRDFKRRAPKRNAVIETPLGKAKIVEYDTPKEQLALRLESGKQIRIPLADMDTSEAAVRKSEELSCPCRPDTVSREALERLQSPEVQMALAELDRANGVVPQETFDESDIFVESRSRRRHRGGKGQARGEQGAHGTSETRSEGGASEGAKRQRRRRRKADASDGALRAAQHEQRGATRVTRHRRRHHEGAETHGDTQATQTKDQPQGRRRSERRRPGDHGGQQAKQGQRPQAGDGTPTQTAGERKPRRRRHRGGRGHGGVGNGGAAGGPSTGTTPSGE